MLQSLEHNLSSGNSLGGGGFKFTWVKVTDDRALELFIVSVGRGSGASRYEGICYLDPSVYEGLGALDFVLL